MPHESTKNPEAHHSNSDVRAKIQLRAWLLERAATRLGLSPKHVESSVPLSSYGLDSMGVIAVSADLSEYLGVELESQVIVDLESVDNICDYVFEHSDLCVHIKSAFSEVDNNEFAVPDQYEGGEHFDLQEVFAKGKSLPFRERVNYSCKLLQRQAGTHHNVYRREILSCIDRTVMVQDGLLSDLKKEMTMFGSNNYLGLANHEKISSRVRDTLEESGPGLAGAPLLSGYTRWHRELEEAISRHKRCESAVLFSSGYSANTGVVSALCSSGSFVAFDAYSHASFRDGLKLSQAESSSFRHNDVGSLHEILKREHSRHRDMFVGVEGLYSMDGDLPPMVEISEVCEKFNATLIIDDAHATGITGKTGGGSVDRWKLKGPAPIVVGTLSKALAGLGGFVCGDRNLTEYLRFMSRSYMFSTAMPPTLAAAATAAFEVLEEEPWRLVDLRQNIRRLQDTLGSQSLLDAHDDESPIFSISVPQSMDVRTACSRFHELNIFVNAVEYPAVPLNQQRFRVSAMTNHTSQDIEDLGRAFFEVWQQSNQRTHANSVSVKKAGAI